LPDVALRVVGFKNPEPMSITRHAAASAKGDL
jgi:hypothetical protein